MNTSIRLTAAVAIFVPVGVALAGSRPDDMSDVEHGNVAFDVSPEGRHVVFSSADGDLHMLDLTTSAVRQLTQTDTRELSPRFSPDGSQIVYVAHEKDAKSSHIFVRSLDGEHSRQLTDTPDVSDGSPSFSSDGQWIAISRAHKHRAYSMGGWTWNDWDVYIVSADGIQSRRITEQKYYQMGGPTFSKDGKTIIYYVMDRGVAESTTILEVDANGDNAPRVLTPPDPNGERGGGWASEPALSPDGSRIAFVSDRAKPFHYDIFIMNRDGTVPVPLGITTVSRYNQQPVFTPDGKSVMFLAGTEFNAGSRAIFSLWQVGADGKDPRRLADSGLFTKPMEWKPTP